MADSKKAKLFRPTPKHGHVAASKCGNVKVERRSSELAETLKKIVEAKCQKPSNSSQESGSNRTSEEPLAESHKACDSRPDQDFQERVAFEALQLARDYYQQQIRKKGVSDFPEFDSNLVKQALNDELPSSKRQKLMAEITSIVESNSNKEEAQIGANNKQNQAKTNTDAACSTMLTLIYGGSVCVFEDISQDKAKAIMVVANNSSRKPKPLESTTVLPPSDDLYARKASLQRFLEKRKDRFRARVPSVETKPRNCSRSPSPAPKTPPRLDIEVHEEVSTLLCL